MHAQPHIRFTNFSIPQHGGAETRHR